MLKHDPWAIVARVDMEERVERAARARLRREARENRAEDGPSVSAILQFTGLFRWVVRLAGRSAPLPRV